MRDKIQKALPLIIKIVLLLTSIGSSSVLVSVSIKYNIPLNTTVTVYPNTIINNTTATPLTPVTATPQTTSTTTTTTSTTTTTPTTVTTPTPTTVTTPTPTTVTTTTPTTVTTPTPTTTSTTTPTPATVTTTTLTTVTTPTPTTVTTTTPTTVTTPTPTTVTTTTPTTVTTPTPTTVTTTTTPTTSEYVFVFRGSSKILKSINNGDTWNEISLPYTYRDVTKNNNKILTTINSFISAETNDNFTTYIQRTNNIKNIYEVHYSEYYNKYYTISDDVFPRFLASSVDGYNWNNILSSGYYIQSLSIKNNIIVVTRLNKILKSTDGTNFNVVYENTTLPMFTKTELVNNQFYVYMDSKFLISDNGDSWTEHTFPSGTIKNCASNTIKTICVTGGNFVITYEDNQATSSSNFLDLDTEVSFINNHWFFGGRRIRRFNSNLTSESIVYGTGASSLSIFKITN